VIDASVNEMKYGSMVADISNSAELFKLVCELNLNFNIQASKADLGGIIGNLNNSTLNQSYNMAPNVTNINLEANESSFGGLVGHSQDSALRDSFNHTKITGEFAGDTVNIGGLIGSIENDTQLEVDTIKRAYNSEELSPALMQEKEDYSNDIYLGAIAGSITNADITKIYSSRIIDSDLEYGQFFGMVENSTLSNSFAIVDQDVEMLSSLVDTSEIDIASDVKEMESFSLDYFDDDQESNLQWDITEDVMGDSNWLYYDSEILHSNAYLKLKNVGYTSLSTEVEGPARVAGNNQVDFEGEKLMPKSTNITYEVIADSGYEVENVIVNSKEYERVSGEVYISDMQVDLNQWEDNTVQINVREIPFYKTRLFFIISSMAGVVALMIIGTMIINYFYAKKLEKQMNKRKKTAEKVVNPKEDDKK
ncbi:MAG: hypothetical protein ACOCP4_06750, partial [Candidatus Woesearchaeota archaeon]